jgi:hypothetical protein
MKEFFTAAQDTANEVDPDSIVTFKHDGRDVTFYQPSDGQLVIMLSLGRRDMDKKAAGTFISLFFELMDEETQRYFENRLLDRNDTFDLSGEGGIFDIWEELVKEWSGGKATKQPSDYQPSRRKTGAASTAPTRRSTSSRSRSAAS